MASLMVFWLPVIFTMVITKSAPAAGDEFKVGGDEGWRQPGPDETEMYPHWAATVRFHIGDSLRFEYNNNDTVVVVDKWGYYHCNSSRAISVFKNGNTVIHLVRPGPVYFVSADPNHCKNGQRLMVDVISPWSPPQPPADDASSPAPSPFSGTGSRLVASELVFFCVVLVVASVSM